MSRPQYAAAPDDIAIVGLSALFPGSRDKDAFWHNIVSGYDAVAEAPDDWALPWYDPDSADLGMDSARIRTRKVGLLGELATFDPLAFGIPPKGVEGDPAHFIGLRLAGDALRDAGYLERPFDRGRTGVIVGHGSSPNRGDMLGLQYGFVIDQVMDLVRGLLPELDADAGERLRAELRGSLPPLDVELAPTLISNVISGRISNRLDLMGPSYLVDSACSSSLIALDLGIRDLSSGRCDMVLVGGIQASMPAQIYMLFQQLGALARTDIRPFDAAANGTLLGEGAGFAVIKRLADAERDGDRIYAVVEGVGVASDGKAKGLLAPRLEGEVMAIRRAYEQTGVDPASIGLLEAHGTGIPLGDMTEMQALSQVFGKRRGPVPTCALGSVKSMIGHCIPAAGMAGLVKTALALHYRVLPPTLCDTVNPQLGIESTPFYVNNQPRPWIHGGGGPRRAGINAFGFGGINTHAILREHQPADRPPRPEIGHWLVGGRTPQQPAVGEGAEAGGSVWAQWPSELCVLSAPSRLGLVSQVEALMQRLDEEPGLSPAALARDLWQGSADAAARLALVCTDRDDLRQKLATVLDKLPGLEGTGLASRRGIYYAEGAPAPGQVVFLFSSEGSQYQGMLLDLALYLPKIRRWLDYLDEVFPRTPTPSASLFPPPTGIDADTAEALSASLHAGDLATEGIAIVSHALHELLRDLGIRCDLMVGHSAGEHVALKASGLARTASMERFKAELRKLNEVYNRLDTANEIPTGTVLSVGAMGDRAVAELLDACPGALYLVADNCPNQVLLFLTMGAETLRQQVLQRITAAGGIYAELPLSRAYHTPLFEPGARALRAYYEDAIETALNDPAATTPVFSCSTAARYPAERGAFLDVLAEQWQRPVRFRETIEALYSEGARTFIELGPGGALTAFVENILKGRNALAVASNIQGKPALEQLQHMLGRLYVGGVPMDLSALFDNREWPEAPVGGQQAAPGRWKVLSGELPRLSLSPELLAGLRQPHAPARGTAAVASSQDAPEPESDRAAMMASHFELMQEFLASQTRVAELLTPKPGSGTGEGGRDKQ